MPSRYRATGRNRPWTPEIVRERIRATQLVKRLQQHVYGEVQMTSTQVRAAEILLRKAVPDLSAVEHSGEITTPQSRDDIIAALTALHAAAVAVDEQRATAGAAAPDSGSTTH